jgi:phosphate transport system permease protein
MVLSGSRNITFEVLTSQSPNSIAAVIAQNFAEAYGLKTNQLIAAGLVLFLITLVVNMIARWIVARRAEYSGAN